MKLEENTLVNVEKVGMDLNKEQLLYLLGFIEDYLDDFIDKVLNDSKDDPHFSAVTVSNIIECYIEINKQIGKELPYTDIKTYFSFNAYNMEEYNIFENSRIKESKYYIGPKYHGTGDD